MGLCLDFWHLKIYMCIYLCKPEHISLGRVLRLYKIDRSYFFQRQYSDKSDICFIWVTGEKGEGVMLFFGMTWSN